MIEFPNKFVDHHRALEYLTQDQIRTMPMLYRADLTFALEKAPILWDFISHLPVNPYDYKYRSLDVKVCMLKKGWYPCIPGWHCDDFFRDPTHGQPDLVNLKRHMSKHFMVVYGSCSLTEFVQGPVELPHWMERGDETIYGFYNRKLNEGYGTFRIPVQPEHLYEFDSMTFHRGLPATKDGWRAFVRLTLGNERPPKNEIRTQVNVYVPTDQLEAGW